MSWMEPVLVLLARVIASREFCFSLIIVGVCLQFFYIHCVMSRPRIFVQSVVTGFEELYLCLANKALV